MATFQVPQFIDQKPKIVGPLTLRQFAFVATAALLSFFSFYIFTFTLWIVVSVILEGIALLLAFGKVNGQDSLTILKAMFSFFIKPRVFIWERNFSAKTEKEKGVALEARNSANIQDKLKSITLNVTTGKKVSSRQPRAEQKQEGVASAIFSTGEKKFIKEVNYTE